MKRTLTWLKHHIVLSVRHVSPIAGVRPHYGSKVARVRILRVNDRAERRVLLVANLLSGMMFRVQSAERGATAGVRVDTKPRAD